MSADIAHELHERKDHELARRAVRARLVTGIGPATMLAGLVWVLVQPWRLTLLHPHGQGFWWLLAEPPLYVVLVGLVFRLVVAPGLVEDLEEGR
ncbi:MAG: hypothetical protein KGL94_13100 [Acidobacteriota bacterium]|nr:hypothetical protein [Acidobacteriota bacterium]